AQGGARRAHLPEPRREPGVQGAQHHHRVPGEGDLRPHGAGDCARRARAERVGDRVGARGAARVARGVGGVRGSGALMQAAARGPQLDFVVPGSIETRTGGYGYDREIVAGLERRGWTVRVHEIPGAFPFPSAGSRDAAAATLGSIPSGSPVIVDGLALGALPVEAAREASRLRLIALVHHPLADETGLSAEARAALDASERRALASVRHVVVTSARTVSALDRFGVPPPAITVIE